MDDQLLLIDGFGPVPVVRPDSVAALGDVVCRAAAEHTALYPVGGQTMLNLGVPPRMKGCAVDMRALASVVDFPARDMTVTVEAGITLGRLRDVLAKERLRLPIDVPQPGKATLGGAVAANASGSRRYGFGMLRDFVIGISAVNDAGREFKAGGRVVKNVAGYDLCKLLVGSLGTLGIVTQLTLKLRPVAEEQALVTLACADDALESLLTQLHGSRTRPVCLDLLNRAAARELLAQAKVPVPDGAWVLVAGFEGNREAVNWQVQQLVREIGAGGSLEALVGFTADPLWHALTDWSLWPGSNVTFRANLLPSGLATFCRAADRRAEKPWLAAHAGNGIVRGHFDERLTREGAAAALAAWRELAATNQGRVVVPRCPPAWKDVVSVWGPKPADAFLMHDVKMKFDPRRLFNPGRFVDGI
jgi:glycolate oxidase FAD binding subunit